MRADGGADSPLIAFGRRAQNEVVTKQDAVDAAKAFGPDVHLSEHGGTGGGVIGALAGASLRAGKEEGRIKGKLQPLAGRSDWSMKDFAAAYGVERFADEEGREIEDDVPIRFVLPTKLIYQRGRITAVLVKNGDCLTPKPKVKKNKKKK